MEISLMRLSIIRRKRLESARPAMRSTQSCNVQRGVDGISLAGKRYNTSDHKPNAWVKMGGF